MKMREINVTITEIIRKFCQKKKGKKSIRLSIELSSPKIKSLLI